MPKRIITENTLPLALHELDKWTGKLTWSLYAAQLAAILGEAAISRHTLLSYPQLTEAFKDRKRTLKETNEEKLTTNITLEYALKQLAIMEAKADRLVKENIRLKEQFVRWQQNLYMMPGVDMEKLNQIQDKPLIQVQRR